MKKDRVNGKEMERKQERQMGEEHSHLPFIRFF